MKEVKEVENRMNRTSEALHAVAGAYDVIGHIEKASAETQDRCEAVALSWGRQTL